MSLADLPDDVLGLISAKITHRDLCNLSSSCTRLRSLCTSDKLWSPQCYKLQDHHPMDLPSWRAGVQSHRGLFRFMLAVQPLVGIWVHQNPELGNLVYVTWGYLSVVGCRIIPQELNPRGMDSGLLWAPVFEIVSMPDGSPVFFLHGRDRDDFCFPGRFQPVRGECNVLLLEAEAFNEAEMTSPGRTLAGLGDESEECLRKGGGSFSRLSFGDRRRLLEILVTRIRIKVPALAQGPLFPRSEVPSRREVKSMTDRHSLLRWMYVHGDPCSGDVENGYHRLVDSETLLSGLINRSSATVAAAAAATMQPTPNPNPNMNMNMNTKKNRFASFVRSKMKQIIGGGTQDSKKRTAVEAGVEPVVESRKLQLHEYLRQCVGVGLRLHAASLKLTLYRAWPIICENRFALYKLPEQKVEEGREFAGLWGATFGWPPGKPADDRAGKALFFLLLSYDESDQGRVLIATKILEGTHYVLHPNGSAMFTAKVDEPSSETFPWEKHRDGSGVEIVSCFCGEGIANGYGFRYPGVKPGDLFVVSSGLLAFVWRESKSVLTLQRFDVREMLRKGEKVAALPPIANFAYLTKANSNVFAGYPGPVGWRSFGKLV